MFDPGILEAIQTGGVLLLFVVGILALVRGDVVTKREFLDERADKEEWKAIALGGLDVAGKAVDVAERVAKR